MNAYEYVTGYWDKTNADNGWSWADFLNRYAENGGWEYVERYDARNGNGYEGLFRRIKKNG